jgi:hypothetical protein
MFCLKSARWRCVLVTTVEPGQLDSAVASNSSWTQWLTPPSQHGFSATRVGNAVEGSIFSHMAISEAWTNSRCHAARLRSWGCL